MSDGIWSALSGAVAQQRALDVTANNVANAGTAGYRADRVSFGEALSRAQGGGRAPDALRFVGVSQVRYDPTSGSIRRTGNPLDLALQGDGFFAIDTPAGVRYTRAGAFKLDAGGTLRTSDGHALAGTAGAIMLPAEAASVTIASDGTVAADGQEVGRIRVVRFESPDGIRKVGASFFEALAGAVPIETEETQIVQGHLESSNVNAVAGMNELVSISRSFEAFQKVIQAFRQLDERTARDVGSR